MVGSFCIRLARWLRRREREEAALAVAALGGVLIAFGVFGTIALVLRVRKKRRNHA